MIPVQFPEPQFNLKKEGDRSYIFCLIRKQWLLLTEEEWVRQNFINYLISVVNYPASLIAVEKELLLNGMKKRFDILVYNTSHQPWLLVECKAPHVSLSEDVLQQALRYNISVPVLYIIITNGTNTLGWSNAAGNLTLLNQLPSHA
ncbi:restriction endonuclease subunit R [Flavisolibacter tropicus]|uniref:Restriction endonuclease subunit R n=1 Tax=Flavisolibacter tropicus TaxID=1492898 RepID=A0A172TU10_9BACT|nr:restriction endonuclease subunit R [Flavisolibacter tropicus]